MPVGADRIMPRLLLVGRDRDSRLPALRTRYGIDDWTTDLDAALARPDFPIFFDAAATKQRVSALTKAIAAGKHIYSEKPVAPSVAEGLALLRAAQARGLKTGAVEDKLHLPGLQKLSALGAMRILRPRHRVPARFRLVGVRRRRTAEPAPELELPAQRRRRAHLGYVSALALRDRGHARADPARGDGGRRPRFPSASMKTASAIRVDVDDTSMTLAEIGERRGRHHRLLMGDARAARRSDDACRSTAPAARRLPDCIAAGRRARPTRRPSGASIPTPISAPTIAADWKEVAGTGNYTNPYRVGWENFLRHVVADAPLASDLSAGIRDVQLAEACYRSVDEGKWISLEIKSD